MKRTVRQRLSDWWKNSTADALAVRKTYELEFMDHSGVRIHLSTRFPRFHAEFSEPPSSFARKEYYPFRAECLADFRARTGAAISDDELGNETFRPIPPPRNRPDFDGPEPHSPSRAIFDARHRGEDRSFRW